MSIPYFGNITDVEYFLDFVRTNFVNYERASQPARIISESAMKLDRLIVYPIKSCDGFEVTEGWFVSYIKVATALVSMLMLL